MSLKKVYCLKPLITFINDTGEEKKKGKGSPDDEPLKFVLPIDWQKSLSETNGTNVDKGYGCMVATGKRSNITVLDFDTMDSYYEACDIYGNLHQHYTVQTRKGMHVYFEYDETIERYISDKYWKNLTKKEQSKTKNPVDTQSDKKGVFGAGTTLTRFNGEIFKYTYLSGTILEMPQVLKNKCLLKKGSDNSKSYTTNIKYDIDVTDEEIRDIIRQLEVKCPDMFNTYSEWIKFTMVMKTINKKEIWDETSERHEGYKKNHNMKIWNNIKKHKHLNYFTTLLGIPKIRSSKKIEPLDTLVEKDGCVIMNTEFFELPRSSNDNESPSSEDFDDFVDTDVIVIQSKTGTGKTTCVANNFATYQLTRPEITILSIANLISLSNQQQFTFKKFGVNLRSYLDKKINPSLIMCQNSVICINSFHKLHDCDFRHKVIYIDEVHALCNSLNHNNTIHNQRLVMNTLLRAIRTCHKVIVSDAHIYNSTMHLLSERYCDGNSTYCHYINEFNKFQDVPAVKFNDENTFFDNIRKKVLKGEPFSFACDSKDVITKWFNWLWAEASSETQMKMILFTSDTESEVCENWTNKIIFYSPKISTGVDITILDQTEQFVYITGKSVSSITLYQMATRTRNMNKLSYYSCCSYFDSKYENREECAKQIDSEFNANILGISTCKIDEDVLKDTENGEDIFRNMYIENTYVLDYFKTNTLKFFEVELKNSGFNLIEKTKETTS